jgi:hypothetical protein
MEVPQGFERFYSKNCVLLLLNTLNGTTQAAKALWLKLLEALHGVKYMRSKAGPCLYYAWDSSGLMIWLSWVDDCLIIGNKEGVQNAKNQ